MMRKVWRREEGRRNEEAGGVGGGTAELIRTPGIGPESRMTMQAIPGSSSL